MKTQLQNNRLETALLMWRKLDDEEMSKCSKLDAQIAGLVEQRRQLASDITEKKEKIEQVVTKYAKKNIGEKYVSKHAVVTWREGYARRSWDDKGLSSFAKSSTKEDRTTWKKISRYLKITLVNPSVKIIRPK